MLSKDLYRQYGARAPEVAWAKFSDAHDAEGRGKWYAVFENMSHFGAQATVPKVMDTGRKAMLDMARMMLRT